jgi:hypothetical protein
MKSLVAIAAVLALFTTTAFASDPKKEDKKEPVKAEVKKDEKKADAKAEPKVKKPCKEGQTEEKDNCHDVKKAEKAKK